MLYLCIYISVALLVIILMILDYKSIYYRDSIKVSRHIYENIFFIDIIPFYIRKREIAKHFYEKEHFLFCNGVFYEIKDAHRSIPRNKENGFWTLKVERMDNYSEMKKLHIDDKRGCYCCLYKSTIFLYIDNLDNEKRFLEDLVKLKSNSMKGNNIDLSNFFGYLEGLYYGNMINAEDIYSYEDIILSNEDELNKTMIGGILDSILVHLERYTSYGNETLLSMLYQLKGYQHQQIPGIVLQEIEEFKVLLSQNSLAIEELSKEINRISGNNNDKKILDNLSTISDLWTLGTAATSISEKFPDLVNKLTGILTKVINSL